MHARGQHLSDVPIQWHYLELYSNYRIWFNVAYNIFTLLERHEIMFLSLVCFLGYSISSKLLDGLWFTSEFSEEISISSYNWTLIQVFYLYCHHKYECMLMKKIKFSFLSLSLFAVSCQQWFLNCSDEVVKVSLLGHLKSVRFGARLIFTIELEWCGWFNVCANRMVTDWRYSWMLQIWITDMCSYSTWKKSIIVLCSVIHFIENVKKLLNNNQTIALFDWIFHCKAVQAGFFSNLSNQTDSLG